MYIQWIKNTTQLSFSVTSCTLGAFPKTELFPGILTKFLWNAFQFCINRSKKIFGLKFLNLMQLLTVYNFLNDNLSSTLEFTAYL